MSEHDKPMADILFKLELLSWGGTQAWNKSGGPGGEPDDRMVSLVQRQKSYLERPPHLHYRELYGRQSSNAGRLAVLTEATEHWQSSVKRTASTEDTENAKTFEECILEDGEGWSAEAVGQHFNIAAAFVRRIRERHARSTEDGSEVNGCVDDPVSRAKELQKKGLTTRQIALTLGSNHTQVARWLKRAA